MCRIALVMSSRKDVINDMINSFIQASQYDPYKVKISKSGNPRHPHGWGYVFFKYNGEYTNQFHYRSIKPVYEDHSGVELLKTISSNEHYKILLLHSRAASQGEVNLFNTHPFFYGGKKYQYWMVHNGTMKIDQLMNRLGTMAQNISDSYLLGELIYELIDSPTEENIIEALREAKKYTKSAMNTINIFYTNDQRLIVAITSYIAKHRLKNKKYIDYYKLNYIASNREVFLGSSTIFYYLEKNKSSIMLHNNMVDLINKGVIINIADHKIKIEKFDI
ncbi:glutamine amidotransferase-like protein [Staphylothermus marinus F1]|uniref:Glutamine amidotransferase-like protein n=1 Tax=Staphylothermus marinus (strain ATCC 43588 / DSM 3639 / JCM 9404 / F1) TaxID=399550 RepID=A3DKQ5_STAMF|nr:class II glutamine amidotransferase [Staphylothermus marinus]ABN69215.1 glutamine amidotransferase-like protein [Staphylothermus marinus F1]